MLFNAALALERLQNRIAADRMWKAYLAVDGSSSWAEEARRHRSLLAALWSKALPAVTPEMVVTRDWVCAEPLRARHYAERTILPDWATATLRGDVESASRSLDLLRDAGGRLSDCSHETAFSTMAKQLRGQPGSDGARLRAAASAILALQKAGDVYANGNGHEVAIAYERAFEALRGAGLAIDQLAAGMAAFNYNYAGERERARRILDASPKDEKGAPGWSAQHDWADAMVHLGDGSPFQALELYRSAMRLFQVAGDQRNVAAMNMLIAETLTYLGADDEAWSARLHALAALGRNGDTRREQTALNEAAEAALGGGYPFVALAYQQAADTLVPPGEDPSLAAYGALWLALIQDRCALRADALGSIQRSRELASTVSDEAGRARLSADIDFAEGVVQQEEDPRRAIALWSTALDRARATGSHYRAAQLLLARGRTARRLGDAETALGDLTAGTNELEMQRQGIADETFRTSYFGRGTELFDELIGLLLERGDARGAYDVAERRRERTLLDAYERTVQATPAVAARVQRGLSEDEVLLQFTVLPDRVIRWEVRPNGIRTTFVLVHRDEIARRLAATYETAEGGRMSPTQRDALRWWDDVLIPSTVRSDRRLKIVPDVLLTDVPFNALLDRTTGRFLVERTSLEVSPSATLFLACRDREMFLTKNVRASRPPLKLVFGDTRGVPAMSLLPLRDASDELHAAA
ncbi:MAG: CHAT domain-containing protein, partial [Acidobacteria bacterium]|nr:CHAT domain-containing protein [Acidobacteriota bacterium]